MLNFLNLFKTPSHDLESEIMAEFGNLEVKTMD